MQTCQKEPKFANRNIFDILLFLFYLRILPFIIFVDFVQGTWELENVGGPYLLAFQNLKPFLQTFVC